MKMTVEGAMQENQGPRWIWRFVVAVLVESVVVLSLLWRMADSALRGEVTSWIVCGILVVAVSSAVDDEVASDPLLPCLSLVSARASVMRRETVSMGVPIVY